jgi:hypothetical protein
MIPGVRIRATNNETGVSVPATSSQAGTFTIPYLLPGFYRVNAELTGFKSAWNQTNLNTPNTAPTNTAFGRVTSTTGDARNWQLSLKLMF